MSHHCPQHGTVNPNCPPTPQCCPAPPEPVCEEPCNCHLVTSNSSSLALSVSGDGTASNAWNVSGQVIIDPSSSAPVLITPNGLKIDCCAETVTQLVDNGDGTLTYVNELGMPTTIALGDSDTTYTLVDIGGGQLALNGSDGSMNVVDVCSLVANNCGDSLIDNGDGTFTHTAIDGTEVTFATEAGNTSSVVDNGDGTYTHNDGLGNETIIDVCQCGLDEAVVNDNGDGTVDIIDGQGNAVTIDVCAAVAAGCTDSLVVNPDGSVTHTAVDGTVVVIPAPLPPSTLVDNGDQTYTHTSGDGTVTVIDIKDDSNTTYDLTDNGDGTVALTGSDGTVDTIDICSVVANNCPDSLIDNGDGTYTHTTVDGVQVTIDITPSSLVDNGDGTYTHTSGDGTVQVIDTNSSSVVDNGDGTYTHSDGAGNDVVIDPCAAVLAGGCVPTITPNGDATYTFDDGYGNTTIIDINEIDMDINNVSITGSVVTFTAEDGTDTVMDICQIVGTNCNSSLTVNADGSLTHVANNGEITVVPAPLPPSIVVDNSDGSFTHTSGDGTAVTWAETVTSLVDNTDGTYTYTSEDGTVTIVAPSVTVVDNGDGTVTIMGTDSTDEIIDICGIVAANCSDSATVVVNADGSQVVTHTAVDGDVQSFTIPAPTDPSVVTPVVTGGNVIATHDDGSGNVVAIEESISTIVDDPAAGTFTFTNEAGVDVVVDYCDCPDGAIAAGATPGTIEYTGSDGAVSTVDVCAIVDANCPETVTSLVLAADGSSFTYTNEDGVDVVVPLGGADVGQAVVTDNTDNTTTIEGTDTAGNVTSDTVINNLLVNDGAYGVSRDIDPAADVLLTEEQPHDPAIWPYDTCDMETFGNYVWKSGIDGKLYTKPSQQKLSAFVGGIPATRVTIDLTDPATPNDGSWVDGPIACVDVTNDACCPWAPDVFYEMYSLLVARLGTERTALMRLNMSFDGGATFITPMSGNSASLGHDVVAQANNLKSENIGWTRKLTQPAVPVWEPGETKSVCLQVCIRPAANQIPSDAALFTAAVSANMYLCGTTICD